MLGDSRSRSSPHHSGCFEWLITCPAKTLISHSNVSDYSFCLLLPVLLSLLDSRALQSQCLSPMKVLPRGHQVPLDFISDDPFSQGAWLSTGLAVRLPAAGSPQPAPWCPGMGNPLCSTAMGQEPLLLSAFATGRLGCRANPPGPEGQRDCHTCAMLRSRVLMHPRAAGAPCLPVAHSPSAWLQPCTRVCAQGKHPLC